MRITEVLKGKILYHGSTRPITKFKIPPYGVFLTPYIEWAEHYGPEITRVRLNTNRIYRVDSDNTDNPKHIDSKILDAVFDRDYAALPAYIKILKSKGYDAFQTETDSEMICVFPGTEIQVLTK